MSALSNSSPSFSSHPLSDLPLDSVKERKEEAPPLHVPASLTTPATADERKTNAAILSVRAPPRTLLQALAKVFLGSEKVVAEARASITATLREPGILPKLKAIGKTLLLILSAFLSVASKQVAAIASISVTAIISALLVASVIGLAVFLINEDAPKKLAELGKTAGQFLSYPFARLSSIVTEASTGNKDLTSEVLKNLQEQNAWNANVGGWVGLVLGGSAGLLANASIHGLGRDL